MVLRQFSLNLRVNVTCDHEQVRTTIVIEIDYSGAPADIACLHSNARSAGNIVESSLTIVVVENVGVIREVRLEKVQMSVEVIVANRNPHPRLFFSVVAEGYASQHSLFAERSIMVVHEEQTRSGIASNINVWPAVSSKSAATTVMP